MLGFESLGRTDIDPLLKGTQFGRLHSAHQKRQLYDPEKGQVSHHEPSGYHIVQSDGTHR